MKTKNRNDLDNILPTAEGLIRLREELHEENDSNHTNTGNSSNHNTTDHNNDLHHDLFTKFPQESLHSFKFTNITVPIDLTKRKKRLHGTLPGHFRSSDLVTANNTRNKTVGSPISKNHFKRKSLPPLAESVSSTSSNTSTTESESDEETYVPHLHNRINQQHQAILTTYDDWRIILTNNIAQDVLVSHLQPKMNEEKNMLLVGKSVMDLVEPSYRNRLKSIILKRRDELNSILEDNVCSGMVLVCGNVIPIIKLDGTPSSASLWLKEKVNEAGSSVYIWIFEEVYESSITITVDDKGFIQSFVSEEGVQDLYDYNAQELIGKNLDILIPSLQHPDWQDCIHNFRFFGSQTKKEAQFPVIVKILPLPKLTVQITSMPMIAGLMTIKANGIIEGCNDIFVKYLFGFSQFDLVEKKNISELLPQFPTLLANLKRDDLLQQGIIINNIVCRKLLIEDDDSKMMVKKRVLTHTPNNQPLPILLGVHRDKTPFEVQLQLKLAESTEDEEYALWISFDRESTFKRFGHQRLISQPPIHSPTLTVIPPSENQKVHRSSSVISVPHDIPKTPPQLQDIVYSAQQTNAVSIDDYEILDTLGEGAYGLVKIAYKKNDPTKTKVVIKYVIKSRILVDCWTRDRKLGTLPVEIHILHTLRKHPHKNLGDMLDYFEDSDHYYIVMGLHGESMDLFDYIELNENPPESELCDIFKQIALGVRHLHDLKIVHRDIKDENVVLDQEGGLRLIDFGSAAYLKPGRKYETFVGTLDYAAPEILRGHTYSGKPQDIWALGILLFTLVYRENPFYNIDEIMERELRIPYVLSEGSVDLISKMLERDVDKRIDIHAVLAHPWLN